MTHRYIAAYIFIVTSPYGVEASALDQRSEGRRFEAGAGQVF